MRYARGAAALALAVALSVAGCGGGSKEPSPLESESAPEKSGNESPSPTPTEAASEQAAIDALRTWIDTANEVRRSLDPAAVEKLESLSTENCRACAARTDLARELAEVGGEFQGEFEETASNIEISGDSTVDDELQILADVQTGSYRVIGEDGTIRNTTAASNEKNRYIMQRKGDRWLVREAVSEEAG